MNDRYQQLLGIPPGPRPPTHYALLGITPNEKDSAEIDEAAQRRTNQLRLYLNGSSTEEASQLLQEIANARRVLIDPSLRLAYDGSRSEAPTASVSSDLHEPALLPPMLVASAPLTIPDPASSPHLCKPLRLPAPEEAWTAATTPARSTKPSSRTRQAVPPESNAAAQRLRPTWRLYVAVVFLPTIAIALLFLMRAGGGTDKPAETPRPAQTKSARPSASSHTAPKDKPKQSRGN